jgi:hypothetical protein
MVTHFEIAALIRHRRSATSRLLKKTHMLRCRSIASLQRTVRTPPLVDVSRASPLDLFEQPARGFFHLLGTKYLPPFQTAMRPAEIHILTLGRRSLRSPRQTIGSDLQTHSKSASR